MPCRNRPHMLRLGVATAVVGFFAGIPACGKKTLNLKGVNPPVLAPAPTAAAREARPDATRAKFKASLKGLPPRALTLGDALATALVPDSDTGLGAKALDAILAALRTSSGTLRPEAEALAILEFAQKYASNIAALAQGDLAALTAFLAKAASEGVLASFDAGVFDTLKEKGTAGVDALVASKVAGVSTSPTPTPSDGGSNTANTAPTAPTSVTISPSTFDAGSTLTCAFAGGSDAEGDTLTPVYTWYKNGTLLTGAATSALAPGSFAKGDSVKCAVALGDAALLSAFTESTSGLVGNRAPNAFTPTLSSSTNRRGGSFTCSATPPSDPDGDAVGAASYRWLQQGVVIAGQTASTFSDAGNVLVKGNTLACEVSFSDATDARTATASTTVGNTPPSITMCVNAGMTPVSQGDMIGEIALSATTSPRLTCTGSDVDAGDTLSWRTFGCLDRYTVNASGQVVLGALGIAPSESCPLHVVVSDGTAENAFFVNMDPSMPNTGDFLGLTTENAGDILTLLPIPEPSTPLKDSRYVAVAGNFAGVGNFIRTGKSGQIHFDESAMDPATGVTFQAGWQAVTGYRMARTVAKLPNGTLLFGGDLEAVGAAGDPTTEAGHPQGLLHTTALGAVNTGVNGLHATTAMGLDWSYGVESKGTDSGSDGVVYSIEHNGEAGANTRIWVGGDFRKIDFQAAPLVRGGVGLACFREDWTPCTSSMGSDTWLGPFATNDFDIIRDLAYASVGGNKFLFVVGDFVTVGGASRRGLVRLDADTGAISESGFSIGTGFSGPAGNLDNFEVRAVTIDAANQKIYVGGDFEGFNGTTVQNLVRLNWDGSLDTSFHNATTFRPFVGSVNGGDIVNQIHLWDHDANGGTPPKIYVAGSFDRLQEKTSTSDRDWYGVARFNDDGSLDEVFCPGGDTMSGCDFPGSPYGFDVRDLFTRADGSVVLAGLISEFGNDDDFPKGMLVLSSSGLLNADWKAGSGNGFQSNNSDNVHALARIDDDSWVFTGSVSLHGGSQVGNFAVWDKQAKAYVENFPNLLSVDETVHQLAYDPTDASRFYMAGSFCSWSNGSESRSSSDGVCGLARFSWTNFTTDVTFTGRRSIFIDPTRIAFLPVQPALGSASGDIVITGNWSAYDWGDSAGPLTDQNDSDPGLFYSRRLARVDGTTGQLEFDFDTGFTPTSCPVMTPNCAERESSIGLSHSPTWVVVDPTTGHTILSGFNSGMATRTYKGVAFTQDPLKLDINGDVVDP